MRASRIRSAAAVGMPGSASQICAYRKSDGSTCAMSAGTPPDRLKCSASTRIEAFGRPDCMIIRAA